MRKKKYKVKNIQRAYNLNAQDGIIMLGFLMFFSIMAGLIVVETFHNNDFEMMLVALILCVFSSSIVILSFKGAVKIFRNRKRMFEQKVPTEKVSVLDEELQNERSYYFENFCVGQEYLINLNPAPYDSVFIKKKKVRFFSVKRVKLGTKYTYWATQFLIFGENGSKLTVNIINNDTANDLKDFLCDENGIECAEK